MIHFYQILNMIDDKQYFIDLFNDLSFELEDMGWKADPCTLINDLLDNHFGIAFECDKQLKRFTDYVLSKQGSLQYALLMVGGA